MHLNAFYRLDPPSLPGGELRRAGDVESGVGLNEVERDPQSYIAHLLKRAASTPTSRFYFRDYYDYRVRIRTAGGWRPIDPSDAPFVSNERQTLATILSRTGLRAFDPGDPVVPAPGPWAQRYDLAWGVESGGVLRIRRRTLESTDPAHVALYRMMTRNRTPEAELPTTLAREADKLRSAVREEATSYPLGELALEARDLIERMTLFNHYLYFKTIDAVIARFSPRDPHDFCVSHLTGIVTALDAPPLIERIRARYPGFELHPSLKNRTIAYRRPLEPAVEFVPNDVEPAPLGDVELDGRRFRHRPYPATLDTVLSFIRCELHFVRFEITGPVEEETAALGLVDAVPEIAGSWSAPTATPVDPAAFWLKEVWRKSPNGGRTTNSMQAFRYALYDPPYGGASEREIEMFEPEIFEALFGTGHEPAPFSIWSVDPKKSSWFINEWWDYCWVLFHKARPEAIVIYGTATD